MQYAQIRQSGKMEIIKVINDVCHSLGKPNFEGENIIKGVDGMHWKELSEIFEKKIIKEIAFLLLDYRKWLTLS